MSSETHRSTSAAEGMQHEALSNEVLMLKIDDLFQEIEQLKRRLSLLEGGSKPSAAGEGIVSPAPATPVVSNPDQHT
jgi:hypothetical protein